MDGWFQKSFNHILRDWKTKSAVSDELKESLEGTDSYDQVCLVTFICVLPYSIYRCIHMLHDSAVNNGTHSWIGCPALIVFCAHVYGGYGAFMSTPATCLQGLHDGCGYACASAEAFGATIRLGAISMTFVAMTNVHVSFEGMLQTWTRAPGVANPAMSNILTRPGRSSSVSVWLTGSKGSLRMSTWLGTCILCHGALPSLLPMWCIVLTGSKSSLRMRTWLGNCILCHRLYVQLAGYQSCK